MDLIVKPASRYSEQSKELTKEYNTVTQILLANIYGIEKCDTEIRTRVALA